MTDAPQQSETERLVERLRAVSFSLSCGGLEETDPLKLIERIEWGVDHIQQVETQRAADLIDCLSRGPRTTWGQVKQAVLNRGGVSERTADDGRIFYADHARSQTKEPGHG